MNGTLAIARREIADRRVIFITAGVLAIVPFAVLLIPEVKRHGAGMVVAATGGFVALAYVLGLALLLGATFIGRELADKRLSFYFAKPVAASSIWFGKLAGNLATIAIAAATILIPSMLASAEEWGQVWKRGAGLLPLVALALFLFAHAIGTMFRSRSPLLLADAACAAVAGAALYAVFHTLARGHADKLRFGISWALLVLLLVFLVAAGAWQLSRGRIDLARSHRELSRFLWSAAGVTLAVLGAIVLWIISVRPSDLGERVWTTQPPAGKWLMIAGPAKHRADYIGAFYVNVQNAEYQRADARLVFWETFFTRDGRVAGQLLPLRRDGKGPVQLELVRFGDKGVEVTPTQLTFSQFTQPVMTDDATRVASVMSGIVKVQSLPDGRTLAVARLPRVGQYARLFFIDRDRVRVYSQIDRTLDIFELDVRTRRLEQTGTVGSGGRTMAFNANADGSRLLMRSGVELTVRDGRSGALLGKLPGDGRGEILGDGRVAIVQGALGKLSLYGTDLALQREIALPGMRTIPFLTEVEGGKLIVGGHRGGIADAPNGRGWSMHVIDLATGTIVRTGRDLKPTEQDFHFGLWQRDPRRVPVAADAPLIFRDERGSVVVWSASTGTKRAVTRASSAERAVARAAMRAYLGIVRMTV
jgi:hypothetical protein